MQELVKTGKNTEINKQSDVKFWLNYIKFGAVSYLISCKQKQKVMINAKIHLAIYAHFANAVLLIYQN